MQFKEGVEKISDLKEGMRLEGVVTNVANFGTFVDIGVHQDGLVHISHLADVFVKDPHDVVKTGERVSVKVLEIDIQRKRIALSMKKEGGEEKQQENRHVPMQSKVKIKNTPPVQSSMANAFASALKK